MVKKSISGVIPTLNEEGNIALLIQRTHEALTKSRIGYELIFIDDHSIDATREIIAELATTYPVRLELKQGQRGKADRKSTRLNSSHQIISYAVFCLKKKSDAERGDAYRQGPHAQEPAA